MKWIPLKPYGYALVDDEDYERLSRYSWYLDDRNESRYPGKGTLYARCTVREDGKNVHHIMHREILNAPEGVAVDHVNGNGLDNRKCNLRFACTQTNAFNRGKPNVPCTSKYKGVLRRRGTDYWLARIKYNDKHVELGRFQTQEAAAAAYNFASRLFFGEYRRENQGVEELPEKYKKCIYQRCRKKIEREGWYVDTDEYRFWSMNVNSAEKGRVFLSA